MNFFQHLNGKKCQKNFVQTNCPIFLDQFFLHKNISTIIRIPISSLAQTQMLLTQLTSLAFAIPTFLRQCLAQSLGYLQLSKDQDPIITVNKISKV